MISYADIDGVQIHVTANYAVSTVKGLPGLAKIRQVLTDRPRFDGSYDDTEFLQARVVELTGPIKGVDAAGLQAAIDAFEQLFIPGVTHILTFQRIGVATREQIGFTSADVDIDQGQRTRSATYDAILTCADPLKYSAIEHSLDSSGVGASTSPLGGLVYLFFPASNGGNAIVTNAGNYRTWPRLRIYGPGTGIKISNQTTGEQLALTSLTVAAGDWFEIDMRAKTVTRSDGLDLRQYLDLANSSFFGVDAGTHTLRLSVVTGALVATTKMSVFWRDARR